MYCECVCVGHETIEGIERREEGMLKEAGTGGIMHLTRKQKAGLTGKEWSRPLC